MKISSDRALYLSRLLLERLSKDVKLESGVDRETLRRSLTREITEAAAELEKIETELRARIEKRRGEGARDIDLLFAREFESELRKHGV
jgi:hypothetical protein